MVAVPFAAVRKPTAVLAVLVLPRAGSARHTDNAPVTTPVWCSTGAP
ncbi:hypothetical protein [Streptomyces caelestis]